jgi:beta-lactamase class D
LKISPEEQIAFIKCVVKTGCGVKAKNVAAFESAALQETKNSISLYAKTGTGPIDPNNFDGAFEGWYVGYLKDSNGKATTAFAIYMEAESFAAIKDYRKELTLKLLADLRRL